MLCLIKPQCNLKKKIFYLKYVLNKTSNIIKIQLYLTNTLILLIDSTTIDYFIDSSYIWASVFTIDFKC